MLSNQERGKYEQDLTALVSNCQESRDHLAGMPVVAHVDMLKKGVDESYVSIIDHVAGIVTKTVDQSPAAAPMKCAEEFAAYVALRMNGFSQ